MTTLAQLHHLPVLDTSTATTIGRVKGPFVDADAGRVTGLHLDEVEGDTVVLPWERIQGWGPDAVTVPGSDALRLPTDVERHVVDAGRTDPLGKRALSEDGDGQGSVTNVAVEDGTGALGLVSVDDREIEGWHLVGVGDFAVVLAPDEGTSTALGA